MMFWQRQILTFTCFQDIVKMTETIVKSLRLHLACREFLLGISSAKISQELVEASPLSHLLPSSYTCLASSTLMISPFTSPPPPSLPFTSVNLPLLLFLLWYSPQISETAVWWCHRSLSQCTRGPPITEKIIWKVSWHQELLGLSFLYELYQNLFGSNEAKFEFLDGTGQNHLPRKRYPRSKKVMIKPITA